MDNQKITEQKLAYSYLLYELGRLYGFFLCVVSSFIFISESMSMLLINNTNEYNIIILSGLVSIIMKVLYQQFTKFAKKTSMLLSQ